MFGDLSSHDELIVRGSLSDRNLLGFYLERGRLIATLLAGQTEETEEGLKRLIKDRAVVDSGDLDDESTDVHTLLSATINKT